MKNSEMIRHIEDQAYIKQLEDANEKLTKAFEDYRHSPNPHQIKLVFSYKEDNRKVPDYIREEHIRESIAQQFAVKILNERICLIETTTNRYGEVERKYTLTIIKENR